MVIYAAGLTCWFEDGAGRRCYGCSYASVSLLYGGAMSAEMAGRLVSCRGVLLLQYMGCHVGI